MKRKLKKIEQVNSKTQYNLIVEAVPTWLEKLFGYSKRTEFYSGYGSIWNRNYFGDLESVSDTEWEAKGYKKRCSSLVEPWIIEQFAKNELSLHKRK